MITIISKENFEAVRTNSVREEEERRLSYRKIILKETFRCHGRSKSYL